MKDVDFAAVPAQQLWAHALTLNADAWQGPADPQRSFFAVMENLLDGGPARTELIIAMAVTPLADLSDYSRRAEVWPRLAAPTRANLLKATAAGWLDRASAGDIPFAPDPQLEAAILAGDRLDGALRALALTGVGAVAQIVSALPAFDESRFLRGLGNWAAARRPLPSADAEALGRVILDRRWRRVLDELVHLARMGRDDVKPALRVCHDMIGIFTRWTLGLSPVHGRVGVGDLVLVEGPFGSSYLREKHAGPILCIAGGSGLAPIKSIVETALAHGMKQPIHLYFGVRTEHDLYLVDHFEGLEARHTNVTFTPVLSEAPAQRTWRTGLVTDAVAQDLKDLDGWKAYVAGPPAMVEAAMDVTKTRGLRPEDLHADIFFTPEEIAA